MTNRSATLALCAALVCAASCTPKAAGTCATTAECRTGETCAAGLCIRESVLHPDAGSPDAGAVDAGTDAGTTDAGPTDAGTPDAGPTDAGTPDAGTPDAGTPDAGTPDAGTPDAGTPDAGTPDAGTPDAGPLGVLIQTPAPDSFVNGNIAVVAQVGGGTAADDLVFALQMADAGTVTARSNGIAGSNGRYTGQVVVPDPNSSGPALLKAAAHIGGTLYNSPNVPVVVDQAPPAISSSWSTGPWAAADGGWVVPAAVSDDLSGVASASLAIITGAQNPPAFNGVVGADGGTASFAVSAAGLAPAGQLLTVPFSLAATDRAGNVSLASVSPGYVLRIDNAPPVLNVAADTTWHNTSTSVSATITDGQGSGVDPASPAVVVQGQYLTGSLDGGVWSFGINVPRLFGSFEGRVAFKAAASDLVGNGGSADGTVLIDTIPPAVERFSAVTGADSVDWYAAGIGTVTLQARVDGGTGSPLNGAAISAGGATINADSSSSGGNYTFALARDAGTGIEGPVQVSLATSDLAGNTATGALQLKFDGVPPQLPASLSQPAGWVARSAGSAGIASTTVRLDNVIDNGSGVYSVSTEGLATQSLTTSGGNAWSGSVSLAGATANAEGPANLIVTAIDKVGNRRSATYPVLVDDKPPALAAGTPDSTWHGAGGSLTVAPSISLTDNGSGAASATLPVGSTTIAAAAQSDGSWKFASFSLPSDPSIETDTYRLTVTAKDKVGNSVVSDTAVVVKLDNNPPQAGNVTLVTAPDFTVGGVGYFNTAGSYQGAAPQIKATLDVTEKYLKAVTATGSDGSTAAVSCGTPSSSFVQSCTVSIDRPLANGVYTYTVNAADLAGNTAAPPPSVVLRFDTRIPTLTITSPVDGGFVNGRIALAATASVPSGTSVTDGVFAVNLSPSDAGVASASINGGGPYSTPLILTDSTLSGPAVVSGYVDYQGTRYPAPPIYVTIDQVIPTISTGWDGGPWAALDGGFAVTAAVNDDRSGVASALLEVITAGGTLPYQGTLDGGVAAFAVPAAAFGVSGQLVTQPFRLTDTDRAGNVSAQLVNPGTILRVDAEPPQVSVIADGTWRQGYVPLRGAVSDGQGSGIASSYWTSTAGRIATTDSSALYLDTPFEGQVTVQHVAVDRVGNSADAGAVFNVDTIPPDVSNVRVTSTPDYGTWFSAKASGLVYVQAAIDAGTLGSPLDSARTYAVTSFANAAIDSSRPASTFGVDRSAGLNVEGPVPVTIVARDTAGNTNSSVILNLNFDDVPPVISAPLKPAGWVARTTGVEIDVPVTDNGSGVATAQLYAGNTLLGAMAADAGYYGGQYSTMGATAGAAGAYALTVVAADNVGNSTDGGISINVDDVPPVIAPVADKGWHSADAGTLSLVASAVITDLGSGVAGATITSATSAAATSADGGLWTFGAVTLPSDPSIESDSYAVAITAQDKVGNKAAPAALFVKLDNRPPVYDAPNFVLQTPADWMDNANPVNHAYYKGKDVFAPQAAPPVSVQVNINETYLASASASVTDSSTPIPGTCSATANATITSCTFAIPRPALSGPYNVTFDAVDQAGNKVASRPVYTMYFDDTLPAVSITAPDGGLDYLAGGFNVAATATTPRYTAGTDVVFALAAGGADAGTVTVNGSGPYSSAFVADPSVNGPTTLLAYLDWKSQRFASAPVQVLLDQTPPVVALPSPADSPWMGPTGTTTIVANVSDPLSGVASATLTLPMIASDGGTITYAGAFDGGTATFVARAADIAIAGQVVKQAYTISATDKVGNKSPALVQAGQNLRVDSQPPTVPTAGDAVWHSSTALVTATPNDGTGSGIDPASVVLLSGGSRIPGTLTGNTWSFNLNVAQLAPSFEGPLRYAVLAKDNVGNAADGGGSILVDDVPPAVSLSITSTPEFGQYFSAAGTPLQIYAAVDGGAGSPINTGSILATWGADAGSAYNPQKAPLYTFDLPRDAGVGFEGAVPVTVNAADTAGNASRAVVNVYFDNLAPVLTPLAPISTNAWVARLDGGAPNTPEIDLGLTDNGTGVLSVVLNADGGTLGSLALKAGTAAAGTWAGNPSMMGAPALTAGPWQVVAVAKDQFSNLSSATYSILVDDVSPVIAADPSNATNTVWHSAKAGNLTFTATANVTDVGSGVASASLTVSGGTAVSGTAPATGTAWSFPSVTLPSTATLESAADAGYPATITAIDKVGNSTTSAAGTITFNVDNYPPTWGTPVLGNTAASKVPDGVDVAGRPWFKGGSLATGASYVYLSDTLRENNLASNSVTFNNATISSPTSCDSVTPTHSCQFTLTRPSLTSVWSGSPAQPTPFPAVLAAADLAGNTAAPQSINVYFDNDLPAKPVITAPATWYVRSSSTIVAVTANVNPNPASGYPIAGSSIDLTKAAALTAGSCVPIAPTSSASDGRGGTTFTFSVPTSCAAAGAEAAMSLSVTATNLVGSQSPAGVGGLNVDDATPVIQSSAVTYPAADGGALGWSHDGSHFNRRDKAYTIPPFNFVVYDCGADVNTGSGAFALTGVTGSSFQVNGSLSAAPSSAGTITCPNGLTRTLWSFNYNVDFGSIPAGTLAGADNQVTFTFSVTDQTGSTHQIATTTAGPASSVNVTRRLWRTPASLNVQTLAVGPRLFAGGAGGLWSLDKSSGSQAQWTASALSGTPEIATNGAQPAVLYPVGGTVYMGDASAAAGSATASCAGSATFDSVLLENASTALVNTHLDTTTTTPGYCDNTCFNPTDCYRKTCVQCGCYVPPVTTTNTTYQWQTMSLSGLGATCAAAPTFPAPILQNASAIGRNNILFVADGASLSATPLAGGTSAVQTNNGTTLIVTDSGGSDAALLYGTSVTKYSYAGAWSAGTVFANLSPPLVSGRLPAPGQIIGLNLSVNGKWTDVDLNGTTQGTVYPGATTLFSPGAAIVDSTASNPVVYLPGVGAAGVVETHALTAAGIQPGIPWALPQLPAKIDDMVLASGGVLYVASGGQVWAILTDSPGVAAGPSWPTRGHDACRSYNLGYTCPY